MKKALFLISVLCLSVISAACINNIAVQELNTKAKAYLDNGEYTEAIERLKSSIDLDDSIFETHYNLAVAYTKSKDYPNAINEYKRAIELNSSVADTYYSLAVAENNLTVNLMSGYVRLKEDGSMYTIDSEDLESEEEEYKPSEDVLKLIADYKADAVSNYKLYLEKNPQAKDVDEINKQIELLEQEQNTDN